MSNCKTNTTNLSSVERDPVFLSQKGKPGGVATLDASGRVPLSQIDIKAMFTEHDPVYIADRGQPFGCATLDGNARVVRQQLGAGAFDSTTFLRGDGVWAVPPGGGGGGIAEGWTLTGTQISLTTSTNRVVVGALPTISKFGVVGDNSADITTIVRGAVGQIASVLEVQDSTSTPLLTVAPSGNVSISGDALIGGNETVIGSITIGINENVIGNVTIGGNEDVTGNVTIGGNETVTGIVTALTAVETPHVLLTDPGTGPAMLYVESEDGSAAAVSGPSTGRIRYNDLIGLWQVSMQGGPYTDMVSGSGNAYRMIKWINTAETADGPVESDAGNTFLAPNVDNFLPLGTSSARFLRVSASDIIGIYLSQGDAEYASELRFDRLTFGIGGNTNPPDVSLRRSAVNTLTISNNVGGGDITIGVVNDALYYDSRNGSNAAVSGATTGRIRYNNTYGYWEQSTLGNPYVPIGDVRDIFRYSMLNNLA